MKTKTAQAPSPSKPPKKTARTAKNKKTPAKRPQLTPALVGVPAYPVSLEIQETEKMGCFCLQELGQARAHALGFLSALLEYCTHAEALKQCGIKWGLVGYWVQCCPGYRDLYCVVLRLVDARRVQNLRDAAYKRAIRGKKVGVWFNGQRVGEEYEPSDKMAELLLRGLDAETFGKVGNEGSQQAVQVNITL